MPAAPFVIFAADAAWRVGTLSAEGRRPVVTDVETARDEQPAQTAAKVAAALSGIEGYRGQGVVLALPSRWCSCATIELDGLPARNRREAMLYRLEGKLPDAAEDLCADFIVGRTSALGVSVLAQSVSPFVEALEAAGVRVDSVCPAAILALQPLSSRGLLVRLNAVAWVEGADADLFFLESERPTHWYHVPADVNDVALRLEAAAPSASGAVGVVGTPSARFLAELAETSRTAARSIDVVNSMVEAAVLGACDTQGGKALPWVEFRRGPLAPPAALRRFRGPLAAALAAGLVLLICLNFALFWRAARYERLAKASVQEQEALFRRVFPSQEVPPDPQSRLASEYRRLQRLSGTGDGHDASASALSLLHRVLTRMPRNVRFLVEDLRLSDDHVYIEGQARSHADADAVAAALREGGAFQVELPRTEQAPGASSVNFSLAATAAAHRAPDAGRRAAR